MSRSSEKGGRWRALTAVLGSAALVSIAATGCSTHDVAVSRPCPAVTKGGKAIAIENRGAIALAKIGLTPDGLKAQVKCR